MKIYLSLAILFFSISAQARPCNVGTYFWNEKDYAPASELGVNLVKQTPVNGRLITEGGALIDYAVNEFVGDTKTTPIAFLIHQKYARSLNIVDADGNFVYTVSIDNPWLVDGKNAHRSPHWVRSETPNYQKYLRKSVHWISKNLQCI